VQLTDRLQRGAFDYVCRYTNPANGLVADTSRPGSPCSIAVVGFALSCHVVAAARGWRSRASAAQTVLNTLQFLWNSEQGSAPDTTGHKGFYYHFLDMASGRRVWDCELSLIDSALLIAGVLCVGQYFDRDNRAERLIRALADSLYRRVDWAWAQNGSPALTQGWHPDYGFLHYGWEGYNEALIIYILGLGSPTAPLSPGSFEYWTLTYQWERLLGQDVLYSGPLFTHLFPHAWIDLRGIRDAFMREKRSDYFQNTCRSVALHREYCERNPHQATGYGRDIWGISAGDGRPSMARASSPRITATSATWRAVPLSGLTMARFARGRCSRHFPSRPRPRSAARARCSSAIRRCAARTASPAASTPRRMPLTGAGCRRAGTASTRDCW
jgi:hypothetical protein